MLIQVLIDLINLDIKTLLAILVWGNLTSIALVYSYRLFSENAKDHKMVKYLLYAKLFQAFAYLLLFYRDEIPAILSVNLGNSFLFIGFYFESITMLEILQSYNQKLRKIIASILVFAITAFNTIEFMRPNSGLRVTIASLCVFTVLVIPVMKLLTTKNMSRFKRIIGVFYLSFICLLLPRAFYTMFVDDVDLFSKFTVQTLTYLTLVLLMVFSLSAYLLLMKESADITIKSLATTDCLTGLSNRYSFMHDAEASFARHKRNGLQLSILFLDIDFFKRINDNYGHSFGDEVLTNFGQIIQTNLRVWDLSCRYGGEEFVILLSQTNAHTGQIVAKRIMSEVESLYFPQHPDFKFTISIGIVNGIPENESKLSDFIDASDRALYDAKNSGRNKLIEYQMESL